MYIAHDTEGVLILNEACLDVEKQGSERTQRCLQRLISRCLGKQMALGKANRKEGRLIHS